ncbi:MAG: glycosyltransferase family 4 protein [Hyphomicrobium sp.]
MRCLALVTDAFGGNGGIAQYNRDFLTALAASDTIEEIIVLPRVSEPSTSELPIRITQLDPRPARLAYSAAALRLTRHREQFDLVFCGHILLSPLGALVARLAKAKLWLQVHGIDAWEKPTQWNRWGVERADLITSVSRYTRDRMLGWALVEPWKIRVLPNTVSPAFSPGSAPETLRTRYGLGRRRVLLTVSRLASNERYKGHDQVIAALPTLIRAIPDLCYLIGGDGDDVDRLKQLVLEAGVSGHVIFAGRIAPDELIEHYRMATAFIMPSTKEGFGIVFLEAAACGTPVIGGRRDGSLDALRDGKLGQPIDPDDRSALIEAVVRAFTSTRKHDPSVVAVFSRQNFDRHVAELVRDLAERGRFREHRSVHQFGASDLWRV